MPHATRRAVLASATASVLTYAAPAQTVPTLRSAASAAGLRYGSDSDIALPGAPAPYRTLFVAQCELLAANMSWRSMSPRGPQIDWEDPNVGFARQHGLTLTGGHFLWHESVPPWVAALPADALRQAVRTRIEQAGARYAGQVFAWNVVNEEIDTRTGDAEGARRSLFAVRLGSGWMADAFRIARIAAPGALLTYNDTGLEADTAYHRARRDALLRILDRLQRDAPIDAVGLQSHLRLDGTPFDPGLYGRFLSTLESRGLKILITELDVLDQRRGPDIAARDADVAARYRDFLAVALAEPAVKSLVTWGLSDRYTWLTAERDPHFGRPDRPPTRPLPFDASFEPKPAFAALLQALRAAPRREPG